MDQVDPALARRDLALPTAGIVVRENVERAALKCATKPPSPPVGLGSRRDDLRSADVRESEACYRCSVRPGQHLELAVSRPSGSGRITLPTAGRTLLELKVPIGGASQLIATGVAVVRSTVGRLRRVRRSVRLARSGRLRCRCASCRKPTSSSSRADVQALASRSSSLGRCQAGGHCGSHSATVEADWGSLLITSLPCRG
jgi:hypothetical protein